MTLPSNPPIDLQSIITTANATIPGYFAQDLVYTLDGHGVPINMLEFLGKGPFTYSYYLQPGQYDINFNLHDRMVSAGWNGSTAFHATVRVGGVLGASASFYVRGTNATPHYDGYGNLYYTYQTDYAWLPAFGLGPIANSGPNYLMIQVDPGGYITGAGGHGGPGDGFNPPGFLPNYGGIGLNVRGPLGESYSRDSYGLNPGSPFDEGADYPNNTSIYLVNNGVVQGGGNANGRNDSGGGAGYYGGTSNATGGTGGLDSGGYGGYNSAPKSQNGAGGDGPGDAYAVWGASRINYSGSGSIRGAYTG